MRYRVIGGHQCCPWQKPSHCPQTCTGAWEGHLTDCQPDGACDALHGSAMASAQAETVQPLPCPRPITHVFICFTTLYHLTWACLCLLSMAPHTLIMPHKKTACAAQASSWGHKRERSIPSPMTHHQPRVGSESFRS